MLGRGLCLAVVPRLFIFCWHHQYSKTYHSFRNLLYKLCFLPAPSEQYKHDNNDKRRSAGCGVESTASTRMMLVMFVIFVTLCHHPSPVSRLRPVAFTVFATFTAFHNVVPSPYTCHPITPSPYDPDTPTP